MNRPSDFEKAKARVYVIALNHRITVRKPAMELVARLKARRLTREEIESITKFCEFYQIDYREVKPYKEKKSG